MKPKLILRIAAGLMVFHAAGHTMGMSQWKKTSNAEQQTVISAMTDHHFPFMGAVHSFADSFDGFGLAATIFMLLTAALLWLTSSFSNAHPQIAKKILLLLFISLAALCAMEFEYFFPFATCITLLAAIFTGASTLMLWKKSSVA